MARMYPNELDLSTESPAERLLYEAFRDGLDNTYTVFHSVAWQALGANGRTRDGEADFIIAHPRRGVLVMEVKGGIIRYEAPSRQWISFSRNDGRAHPIKDPFGQARAGKYTLHDMLARMSGFPPYKINLGHAVAFPDITLDGEFLGPDRPPEIILDQAALANLSGWIGACLAYYRSQATQADSAPTEAVVENLMEVLGRSWELRPKMWGEFQLEQQKFIQLTREQYLYLDFLNRHRRASISGCAGSGKTMMAVEKAARLARQGFRTLLTCFNKTLAIDLRLKLPELPNLDIIHFHELCYKLAEQAEMLPAGDFDERYFDQLLPEALIPAADQLGVRYHAIVVDEGQDFQDHWWLPLQLLLEDPDEGILYIFFDDNQRIYVPNSTFPIQSPPHGLSVNCRNTQAIHKFILNFYQSSDHPSARGPQGRPVEVVTYTDTAGLRDRLREILIHLEDQGIPADEIAVLPFTGKRKSQIWSDDLTDQWPPPAGKVYCSTVQAFKGLERSVIILAGIEKWMLESWQDIDKLIYVGSSRARNHLILLMSDPAAVEYNPFFE